MYASELNAGTMTETSGKLFEPGEPEDLPAYVRDRVVVVRLDDHGHTVPRRPVRPRPVGQRPRTSVVVGRVPQAVAHAEHGVDAAADVKLVEQVSSFGEREVERVFGPGDVPDQASRPRLAVDGLDPPQQSLRDSPAQHHRGLTVESGPRSLQLQDG